MFQVKTSDNRLERLAQVSFGELGFHERDHLQEWLAHTPDVLGEELLIIQKEFDGFADTRERLDLLALDEEGRIVVIENKLDDSGKDVVWQALKYASYCSSLKKSEIIEIYQRYLDKQPEGGEAFENLRDFFGVEDLDEIVLNSGNEQRVVMIAANFRKEVTATALWLLGHGMLVQCFQVVPYTFDGEILVDIKQIIPTPEAESFMIGMTAKDSEEKTTLQTRKRSQVLRQEFWTETLRDFRERRISLFENISPSFDHWLSCATGSPGCAYTLIFGLKFARVELYLSRSVADENKMIFDRLELHRNEIEEQFGTKLHWQRLNEKKACRVSLAQPFDGSDRENWPEMINWLRKHIVKLQAAFSSPLKEACRDLKSQVESDFPNEDRDKVLANG